MPTIINNKNLQKIIGENIEQMRLIKKKPIKEIASALQFSGTAYRNIERGITNPSIGKLFEIAVLLEVNIIQLFDFDINTIRRDKRSSKKAIIANQQLEENFHQRIQQYKDENTFLKKRIETLEMMITGKNLPETSFAERKMK